MRDLIKKFPQKGLNKFLSEDEIKLVKSYQTAAGFWAAKEAFSKAIKRGIGKDCSFKDIKIYKDENGAPNIALSKNIVQKFNILDVTLSITHDGEYAISVVNVKLKSTATNKVKQF